MIKKILVATKSFTISKVLELSLSANDCEVVTVSDGDAAIAQAANWQPQLLLCEVIIPGKNGYEVVESLKANPATQAIPVVLLTGTFAPFDKATAQRVGAVGKLSMPCSTSELVNRVNQYFPEAPFDVPFESESGCLGGLFKRLFRG